MSGDPAPPEGGGEGAPAERAGPPLHPLVRAASEGCLPEWARVGRNRRAHMERVSRLLGRWSRELGLPPRDLLRWRAAGYLHDLLREAPPEHLRSLVPPGFRDLPPSILHGPAAAVRLREEGVDDPELLQAVAFHTLGHPDFGLLGRALYAADFLEPGRSFRSRWRGRLRRRAPAGMDEVLVEILAARMTHLLRERSTVRPETLAFWNALVGGGR